MKVLKFFLNEKELIKVRIDNALPFFKTIYFEQLKSSSYFPSLLASVLENFNVFNRKVFLIYARSARKNNYICILFLKKYSLNKLVINSINVLCILDQPFHFHHLVMYNWFLNKKASKQDLMNCIKFEVGHKRSLVIGVSLILHE